MDQNAQTQTPATPFVAILNKALNTGEYIALVGVAVGAAMLYLGMPGAQEVLMVVMSALSGIFFLRGYQKKMTLRDVLRPGVGEPKRSFFELLTEGIVPRVGWISCSVVTVGILFHLLNLNGAKEMLMIGCSAMTFAVVLAGIAVLAKPERTAALMPLIYRAVPLWLVGVYFFMSRPA